MQDRCGAVHRQHQLRCGTYPPAGGGLWGCGWASTPLSYIAAVDFDGDGITIRGFDPVAHRIWWLPSDVGGWSCSTSGGTYTIVN